MRPSFWIYGFAAPFVLALLGNALHRALSLRERKRFPPPGELVDVGGHQVHFQSRGAGGPTVILDAALAGTSLSWFRVQPEVAAFTRAVSYDRGGFGWSDPAPGPRRVDYLVEELRRGLASAGLPPPFVLVGHSYGGFVARLFASRHPDEVAGMVLVDVPHPREWMSPDGDRLLRVVRGARASRRAALLAHFGLTRLLLRFLAPRRDAEPGRVAELLSKVPGALRPAIRSFWVRPPTLGALSSLIENAPESAAIVEAAARERFDGPLIVLSAAAPSAERLRDQEQVVKLSTRGRHVVSERSGHWIPLDEPELVVKSIREVVDEVRALQAEPERPQRVLP